LGDLGKKERLILKFIFKTWRASEKKRGLFRNTSLKLEIP
jgi:hypothetical protein